MKDVEIACKIEGKTNCHEITMYVALPIDNMDEIDEWEMSIEDSDKMIREHVFEQYGMKICNIRVLGSNY